MAIHVAGSIATRIGATEVLPIHLAFGALCVDGNAWQTLAGDESATDRLSSVLSSLISQSSGERGDPDFLKLSSAGKEAIDRAYELSKTLRATSEGSLMGRVRTAYGWTRIGTDHLLLACIQVDQHSRSALGVEGVELRIQRSCHEAKEEPMSKRAEVRYSALAQILEHEPPAQPDDEPKP